MRVCLAQTAHVVCGSVVWQWGESMRFRATWRCCEVGGDGDVTRRRLLELPAITNSSEFYSSTAQHLRDDASKMKGKDAADRVALAGVYDARAARRSSATQRSRRQRGESPLRVYALRPETERNCEAAMPCGEHLEVKSRPAT